uniref:Uncharacterized protein n=1 Tax=Nelumbo nucifera TaxID=4432 RepID=A0A822ZSI8_NELNU|nr:TPA_asm: hypothetical protein HUJ06_017780 [Nelumbo nucifera]
MCIIVRILKAPVDKRCWGWSAKMVLVAGEPLKEVDEEEISDEDILEEVEPMWDRCGIIGHEEQVCQKVSNMQMMKELAGRLAVHNLSTEGGLVSYGPSLRASPDRKEFKFINQAGKKAEQSNANLPTRVLHAGETERNPVMEPERNRTSLGITVAGEVSLKHVKNRSERPNLSGSCRKSLFQEDTSAKLGSRNLFPAEGIFTVITSPEKS